MLGRRLRTYSNSSVVSKGVAANSLRQASR